MASIPDVRNMFSDEQAITASAASTNAIQLDSVASTNGQAPGKPLWFYAWVTEGFNTLTSLTVGLQTSDDNSTWTNVVSTTSALAAISSTTGTGFIPFAVKKGLKKWVRLYYTVTGTAPTTGAVSAMITNDVAAVNSFSYTA